MISNYSRIALRLRIKRVSLRLDWVSAEAMSCFDWFKCHNHTTESTKFMDISTLLNYSVEIWKIFLISRVSEKVWINVSII